MSARPRKARHNYTAPHPYDLARRLTYLGPAHTPATLAASVRFTGRNHTFADPRQREKALRAIHTVMKARAAASDTEP